MSRSRALATAVAAVAMAFLLPGGLAPNALAEYHDMKRPATTNLAEYHDMRVPR